MPSLAASSLQRQTRWLPLFLLHRTQHPLSRSLAARSLERRTTMILKEQCQPPAPATQSPSPPPVNPPWPPLSTATNPDRRRALSGEGSRSNLREASLGQTTASASL